MQLAKMLTHIEAAHGEVLRHAYDADQQMQYWSRISAANSYDGDPDATIKPQERGITKEVADKSLAHHAADKAALDEAASCLEQAAAAIMRRTLQEIGDR